MVLCSWSSWYYVHGHYGTMFMVVMVLCSWSSWYYVHGRHGTVFMVVMVLCPIATLRWRLCVHCVAWAVSLSHHLSMEGPSTSYGESKRTISPWRHEPSVHNAVML